MAGILRVCDGGRLVIVLFLPSYVCTDKLILSSETQRRLIRYILSRFQSTLKVSTLFLHLMIDRFRHPLSLILSVDYDT